MHIKKVFVEVENLAVFVELKRKKQDSVQFSLRYQETKLFCGYFSHLYEFYLSCINCINKALTCSLLNIKTHFKYNQKKYRP
jgi:hypothetical protein